VTWPSARVPSITSPPVRGCSIGTARPGDEPEQRWTSEALGAKAWSERPPGDYHGGQPSNIGGGFIMALLTLLMMVNDG